MARSEEAILRRALKRERTEGQQRNADRNDMMKQEQKQKQKLLLTANTNNNGTTSSHKKLQISSKDGVSNNNNNNNNNNNKRRRITKPSSSSSSSSSSSLPVALPVAVTAQVNSTSFPSPSVSSSTRRNLQSAEKVDTRATTTITDNSNMKNNNKNVDAVNTDPMKEDGAWICTKCNNSNFASRRVCNSKTCDQPRPSMPSSSYQRGTERSQPGGIDSVREERQQHRRPSRTDKSKTTKSRPRHDETTSKKLLWSKQAPRGILSKNQELRQQFHASKGTGTGMDPKDYERAKILVLRDQRKQEKKKKQQQKQEPRTITINSNTEDTKQISSSSSTTRSNDVDKVVKLKDTDDTELHSESSDLAAPNEEGNEKHNKESDATTAAANEDANNDRKDIDVKEGSNKNYVVNKIPQEGILVATAAAAIHQSKQDQNTALRTLFLETGGKGMKMEQVERAQVLVARYEKKQQQRRRMLLQHHETKKNGTTTNINPTTNNKGQNDSDNNTVQKETNSPTNSKTLTIKEPKKKKKHKKDKQKKEKKKEKKCKIEKQ